MAGLLGENSADPRAAAAQQRRWQHDRRVGGGAAPLESWVTWVMMALVAAGLLAVVGVAMRRNSGTLAPAGAGDQGELHAQLVSQIALLDDQHALGQVSDADWSARRAYLKAQLINVMQKQEK